MTRTEWIRDGAAIEVIQCFEASGWSVKGIYPHTEFAERASSLEGRTYLDPKEGYLVVFEKDE